MALEAVMAQKTTNGQEYQMIQKIQMAHIAWNKNTLGEHDSTDSPKFTSMTKRLPKAKNCHWTEWPKLALASQQTSLAKFTSYRHHLKSSHLEGCGVAGCWCKCCKWLWLTPGWCTKWLWLTPGWCTKWPTPPTCRLLLSTAPGATGAPPPPPPPTETIKLFFTHQSSSYKNLQDKPNTPWPMYSLTCLRLPPPAPKHTHVPLCHRSFTDPVPRRDTSVERMAFF